MGRKAFYHDLQDAAVPGRFAQICQVTRGADEGALSFVFRPTDHAAEQVIMVDVIISDVSDYPSCHNVLLFTTTESASDVVTKALESVQASISGYDISQMLTTINRALSRSYSDGDVENSDPSEAEDDEKALLSDYATDADNYYATDADNWSNSSSSQGIEDMKPSSANGAIRRELQLELRSKIRSDLFLAKKAGFKIGILGDLNHGGILCVAIKLTKLGLSSEAIHAWSLARRRSFYLVLLIRYHDGYKGIMEVKGTPQAKCKTEFRVALCKQYKPTWKEAISAFNRTGKPSQAEVPKQNQPASEQGRTPDGVLEPLFIDRPLNEVLKTLPALIQFRIACSCSWTAAERFHHDAQAKASSSLDMNAKEFAGDDRPASTALPAVVLADHLSENLVPEAVSLPLVAMQFVLRHLVRCTEFCLVCHCRVDTNFEALKPYVCSKPLCLFQHLTLGFGQEMRFEIASQPLVVDLLISFCYSSAQGKKLQDFPIGLGLKVPCLTVNVTTLEQNRGMPGRRAAAAPQKPLAILPDASSGITSKLDFESRVLILSGATAPETLKVGVWVAVAVQKVGGSYHACVEETFFPNIRLGELIRVPDPRKAVVGLSIDEKDALPVGLFDARVFVYDQNFDELSNDDKQDAITVILDTLPGVKQMKSLLEDDFQHTSVGKFRTRISATAWNLLRWVIASNRSCIVQVDQGSASQSLAGAEDRVSGMDDFMQFRFAQGAPDKEQRFVDCVKTVSARLDLGPYPTLFAFHGSRLLNWHSIVREGLNFNTAANGRAYGDGVYMSASAAVSIAYCGQYAGFCSWRNSELQVTSAFALNEVVNVPSEFVRVNPHYVVNELDFIQTRYLFVKGRSIRAGTGLNLSERVYEQDPKRTARNESGQPVIIPLAAVNRAYRPVETSKLRCHGAKKAKVAETISQAEAETFEDDAASMMTNASDLEVFGPEDQAEIHGQERESTSINNPLKRNYSGTSIPVHVEEAPKTTFVPGTLQAHTLPLLAAPTSASTSTTKILMTALKQTLGIQTSTPSHELGWYISDNLVTNIYQWPLELHSFPSHLPLAADMQKANLKSVVLELRFSSTFPMTPPFVRVIRPRFLPFMNGGGGHVTSGGALCMELLTNSGWSAASSLESVLLQVRMAICSTDPAPARLMGAAGGGCGAYSVGEAISGYKRACQAHGWQIPREVDEFLEGKLQPRETFP